MGLQTWVLLQDDRITSYGETVERGDFNYGRNICDLGKEGDLIMI